MAKPNTRQPTFQAPIKYYGGCKVRHLVPRGNQSGCPRIIRPNTRGQPRILRDYIQEYGLERIMHRALSCKVVPIIGDSPGMYLVSSISNISANISKQRTRLSQKTTLSTKRSFIQGTILVPWLVYPTTAKEIPRKTLCWVHHARGFGRRALNLAALFLQG